MHGRDPSSVAALHLLTSRTHVPSDLATLIKLRDFEVTHTRDECIIVFSLCVRFVVACPALVQVEYILTLTIPFSLNLAGPLSKRFRWFTLSFFN